MRKRPLCVVLLLLAAGILFAHSRWKEKIPIYESEEMSLLCELEEITEKENSCTLLVSDVHSNQKLLCHKMKLYTGEDTELPGELHIGNLLQIEASVSSFSEPGNPGQFNEYQYNTEQGISYKGFATKISIRDNRRDFLQDSLYKLRCYFSRIIDACCEEKTAGIISAMVLGDKTDLSEETKRLYQENGIAHVLAISGLHISLIGAGLFFLLRKYVMPMQAAVVVTMILLVLYGILTGFSVSTQRAVCMMGCMLFARIVGRRYDPLSALALSAILELLVHPYVLFQTGFQLSYGTVAGIVIFVKYFQDMDLGNNILPQAFLGSLGIQLVTLPILLSSYFEISLYSVVANVILLPLMGGILTASIGGIAIGCMHLLLGKFCFGFVHYCFLFFDVVCHVLGNLPCASLVIGKPYLWQILLYYAGILLFCLWQKKSPHHRNLLILVLGLVVLCLPVHRVSGLQITNLDVGQGDCTCIRTNQGTMLVDGGSSDVKEVGKYRIVPFLKSQGISRLDTIFVTHSDGDHISGIQEILEAENHMGLDIGAVVLPQIEKKDEGYLAFAALCQKAGVPLVYMEKGDRVTLGKVQLLCLHPYSSYDWESENDYSLVLQLQYQQFTGMLTGDLEMAGEQELFKNLRTVDYLKVGHHGSNGSSSTEFLNSLMPRLSVVSCGRNNRYGHPHQELLERLAAVGTKVVRTDYGDAVTVSCDGEAWQVEQYSGGG